MAEASTLWSILTDTANPAVVAALEREVASAPDSRLARINPIAFAARHALDEDALITALVHATRLGLFDLSWNMLCPGCGGVLETGSGLKSLNREEFFCSMCAAEYKPTLDELVEATFTVNPRIRRIVAHDPDRLPHVEYLRQVFWSSGLDLPEDLESEIDQVVLESFELAPGEKATMSLTLPAPFAMVLDPVTHTTLFLEISGEETRERRNVTFVLNESNAQNGKIELRPGPVRIAIENRSARRTLPGVWVHNEHLKHIFSRRRPFLTALRLMSNQTFRDVYRNATLDPEQRFKITNLTILFTDLRGSTALYDRVGDLAAFDLVRSHFVELLKAVSTEGGAVVKTIGDAVMATFPSPDRGVRAAMRMREAIRVMNSHSGEEDLALNIGLHEGPCLAVTFDDRSDFFGQAVNIASRVQRLADPSAVLATKPIVADAAVASWIKDGAYQTNSRSVMLRGVSDAFEVYEIHEPA